MMNQDSILIQNHYFVPYIHKEEIQKRVAEIGKQLTEDYEYQRPLLLCMLNGAFIFAADLVREINTPSQISFIKYTSYQKEKSSEQVNRLIGLNESIENRPVLIIEDIVDTGNTMFELLNDLKSLNAKSIKIVSLLFKPSKLQKEITPDYIGFTIPDDFVIGYGLDYDGHGRYLKQIYRMKSE